MLISWTCQVCGRKNESHIWGQGATSVRCRNFECMATHAVDVSYNVILLLGGKSQ